MSVYSLLCSIQGASSCPDDLCPSGRCPTATGSTRPSQQCGQTQVDRLTGVCVSVNIASTLDWMVTGLTGLGRRLMCIVTMLDHMIISEKT